LYVALASALR